VSILPLVFFILLRVRFPLAVFLSALNVAVFTAYWSVVLCNNKSECKMDEQIFSQVRARVRGRVRVRVRARARNGASARRMSRSSLQARLVTYSHHPSSRRSSCRWLYLLRLSLTMLYLLCQVVSVTSLIALVSGYGGYMRERALRRDFLLQLQVNSSPSPSPNLSPSLSPSPNLSPP
jgi:hypothetical protein